MFLLEKVLLDSANEKLCSLDLPEEFGIYKNNTNFSRLKVQHLMLPDLIATHNTKCESRQPM